MKNASYYIAPVGVRTHDLPHTVASNMDRVSYALTHSATAAVCNTSSLTMYVDKCDVRNNNEANLSTVLVTNIIMIM